MTQPHVCQSVSKIQSYRRALRRHVMRGTQLQHSAQRGADPGCNADAASIAAVSRGDKRFVNATGSTMHEVGVSIGLCE
jgi:hypothetical protein